MVMPPRFAVVRSTPATWIPALKPATQIADVLVSLPSFGRAVLRDTALNVLLIISDV
jgi:hypothetical protein